MVTRIGPGAARLKSGRAYDDLAALAPCARRDASRPQAREAQLEILCDFDTPSPSAVRCWALLLGWHARAPSGGAWESTCCAAAAGPGRTPAQTLTL